MFDQNFIDRLAQALAARIIPQIPQSNGGEPQPRLLTAAQAAVFLGRPSAQSIYHLVSRGEIPFVKQNRVLRFDIDQLRVWISRGKRGRAATSQAKGKEIRQAKGQSNG